MLMMHKQLKFVSLKILDTIRIRECLKTFGNHCKVLRCACITTNLSEMRTSREYVTLVKAAKEMIQTRLASMESASMPFIT